MVISYQVRKCGYESMELVWLENASCKARSLVRASRAVYRQFSQTKRDLSTEERAWMIVVRIE